mgnify:FL=1
MKLKPILVLAGAALATSLLLNAPTGAHSDPKAAARSAAPMVGVGPLPGDSFRITFHKDGQEPTVEGVTTDPVTGERYWSGPQDTGPIDPGKSFKEKFGQFPDPEKDIPIEILGFKLDEPDPQGKIKTLNPPWNTHCHTTVIIGGKPYTVHC